MVRAGDRGVGQFGGEPDVVAVEAESIEGGGFGWARLALGHDRESEAAVEGSVGSITSTREGA